MNKIILTYCCGNCKTRYEVEYPDGYGLLDKLRCPDCGLDEVYPEFEALPGYTIREGELVKK